MRLFGNLKRKNTMVCRSEEEMNRKMDSLIEQGYQAESETGVMGGSNMCFTTYTVTYWK